MEVVAYIWGEHHILQLQWLPILHIHAQLAKPSRREPRALKTRRGLGSVVVFPCYVPSIASGRSLKAVIRRGICLGAQRSSNKYLPVCLI